MPQSFELDADRLISYPSADRRFNAAYETALKMLESSPMLSTVYVVQYRDRNRDLCYGVATDPMFDPGGGYHTSDVRAVVRKPRLILEAQCTICGPVSDVESDANIITTTALLHVARTGHVVVFNGTADVPQQSH